jgi:SNF2 family DNA or RNA helicase
LINRWNAREHPLVYAHADTASHGLNLQGGGHHIILFGAMWSLDKYLQLIGRLARSGQESDKVFIHHIVAKDTIESDIMLPRLQEKEDSHLLFLQRVQAYRARRGV